jgi:hypothetical protein
MIHSTTGEIELQSGERIGPSLTESQFLSSPLSKGARALATDVEQGSYRTARQLISGHTFRLIVRFRNARLVAVEMVHVDRHSKVSWDEASEQEEQARKATHDAWLERRLGRPPYSYPWGEITSVSDPQGGYSHIVVRYA